MWITDAINDIATWPNANQGVVSILLFVVTLIIGQVSGIFQSLRHRPRFRILAIEGPTLCCTFLTGSKRENFDIHRTAFALYLHITNIGSASSSIDSIHLGYHWNIRNLSLQWFRYRIGWFWLTHQTAVIHDFQASIGDNLKIYPFLFQRSILSDDKAETFLQVGQSTNGVVYFEQGDSWGACSPRIYNGQAILKVRVIDAFGKNHVKKLSVPSVTLDEANKFNPSFGLTLAHLRGELDNSEDIEAGNQPSVSTSHP